MIKLADAALCALLIWAGQASAGNQSPSVDFLNALFDKQLAPQSSTSSDNQEQQFSDHYINIDGQRLHYVSAGRGKLIIFYHGFPSYWYMWKNQLLDLAKDYHVVAVDGLGANLSDKPEDLAPYHISALSKQLNQLIQALTAGRGYVLVGHDWGGALAWSYAQQYPEGLDRLVVLNAPPTNLLMNLLRTSSEQRQASTYIERLKTMAKSTTLDIAYANKIWEMAYTKLINQGHISEPEGQLYKAALAQPGAIAGGIKWYEANIPAPDKIVEGDFWPSSNASTSVSSMLIWGEDDRTFVPAFLQQMPRYADQLRIEILPGIRHWPSLEAPERVNSLIRDFIESPQPAKDEDAE